MSFKKKMMAVVAVSALTVATAVPAMALENEFHGMFGLDSTWGKDSYTVDRANGGGALGADTINLETKWVYLDWNCPLTGANFKAGLQGVNDAYTNIFIGGGADAAGLLVSKGIGPVTLSGGWFRLDDRSATNTSAATFNNATLVNTSGNAGNVTFTDGKRT